MLIANLRCARTALGLLVFAGLVLGWLLPSGSCAEDVPPKDAAKRHVLINAASQVLKAKDSWAAVEYLCGQEDSLAATEACGDLMHLFYEQRKDLRLAITFGRAGVQLGLTSAIQADGKNPASARELREEAWALCYDLASFTWPGWAEPGITITGADLALGMDAARANLRLTKVLKKGDLQQSRACWMIGAQYLAAGKLTEARATFAAAASHAAAAKEKADELMNIGYERLVDVLAAKGDAGPRQKLEACKKQLKAVPDGAFFADQIDTALRVFLKD